MLVAFCKFLTFTAPSAVLAVLPSPSAPSRFSPQHFAPPLLVTTQYPVPSEASFDPLLAEVARVVVTPSADDDATAVAPTISVIGMSIRAIRGAIAFWRPTPWSRTMF